VSDSEARYRAVLDQYGVADVQPAYRLLLWRLKASHPSSYDAAVERYERELLPSLEAGEEDPLRLWLNYGMWIAEQLHRGHLVAVDDTGLATPVDDEPPLDRLLLHVPEKSNERAIALVQPARPSEAQTETVQLLCG
jgi:hypothetical protein